MGIVRLRIVFGNRNKVFRAGEIISGRVELTTYLDTQIKGVELKIKGKAKCEWNKRESGFDTTRGYFHRTVPCKQTEVYLCKEIVLIGGEGEFNLPMGDHFYPFVITLPKEIPSSFHGSYGGVIYYAKAEIDIYNSKKKKERKEFTVVNPLNLNSLPDVLSVPYRIERSKSFCNLWCTYGTFNMVLTIPKTGFAVSESIPITLNIDNSSSVTINDIHITLKRNVRWMANGYFKDDLMILRKLTLRGVNRGNSRRINVNVVIPCLMFPNLENCSIIKVYHDLNVEVSPSGMRRNLKTRIPITIGNIALNADSNDPRIIQNHQTSFTDEINNLATCLLSTPLMEPPPPYSESKMSSKNSKRIDNFSASSEVFGHASCELNATPSTIVSPETYPKINDMPLLQF